MYQRFRRPYANNTGSESPSGVWLKPAQQPRRAQITECDKSKNTPRSALLAGARIWSPPCPGHYFWWRFGLENRNGECHGNSFIRFNNSEHFILTREIKTKNITLLAVARIWSPLCPGRPRWGFDLNSHKTQRVTNSSETNAKTPSDSVAPELRQEKKVANHKNRRNEDPTAGRTWCFQCSGGTV
jgi:hypothetical protein